LGQQGCPYSIQLNQTLKLLYIYNQRMNHRNHHFAQPILLLGFLLSACQPIASTPEARIETPVLPVDTRSGLNESQETTTRLETASTPLPPLPPVDSDSDLCENDPNSLFITNCENGSLVITRKDDPRRLDIFFNREEIINSDAATIQAEVVSTPPDGQPLDQNQFGLYFSYEDGSVLAVRVSGQYFNFETWSAGESGLEVEYRTNRVFCPHLKPASQSNFLELDCGQLVCDLMVNGSLAGRIPPSTGSITSAGLFAAADWDQSFGRVAFTGFDINKASTNQPKASVFTLSDDLTADRGTFSARGLSGAFNQYEPDGFHFSPIVPFEFYSVRTGPSLADVSIEVDVLMEIAPGVSGSQFAGVACRSSQEGAYIATIKVDGTYTLFRDTPQRPLAVLARKASEAILPGRQTNTLRLDCGGDQIDFYINETQVASVTDTRFNVDFGRIGLYTKASGSPQEDAIVFSNLIIMELR